MTETQQALLFDDGIVSTASEPITTKELLARLSILQKELSELDQATVDLSSLEKVKSDLVNKKLLKNTNLGVQIYVACCLSDILRLFAPDAPYNDTTLLNIFRLFLSQFQNLDNVDSSFYDHYVYLLERVAEVELIVLLTDLDNNDKLIVQLFECFYSLSSSSSFDSNSLESFLVDILGQVISEVNQLDLKVLKLILNKFLVNSKNLKNQSNIKVPGFNISLELCELNADKLSRLITFFFSEMILQATDDAESDIDISDSDQEDSQTNPKKIDIVQLRKVHNLAIELWRYVPEVLTSVLGLLDNELEAEALVIRSIATETVSNILAIQPSRINFATAYTETYMNWLKKPLDISFEIRINWISGLSKILENRNDITQDIINGVLKTMMDSNEKVRFSTIVELSKLKPDTFLNNVLTDSISTALFKLLREKNTSIRNEIIFFLSTLYNYQLVIETENKFIKKIPNNILGLIFINNLLINATVDLALFEKLLPFTDDATSRVTKFLSLVSVLNQKSLSSLFAMMKRQTQFSIVLFKLLTLVEEKDDLQENEQIENAIKWISKSFPPSYNAQSCLEYFFSLNNKRINRLLVVCSNKTTDYETIVNSIKEILNRVSDMKLASDLNDKSITKTNLYDTIKLLLLRCFNIFYNVDNIYELIMVNNDKTNPLSVYSKVILNNISEICPAVLESSITILLNDAVRSSKNLGSGEGDCFNDLKIVYKYMNQNDTKFELTNEMCDALFKFSIKGSVKEAKYSVRLLTHTSVDRKGVYFTKMVNHIWPLSLDSIHFNTHLSTLSELFSYDIVSVDMIKEDLSKYLATNVLLKNTIKEESEDSLSGKWISDEELYHDKKNFNCVSKIITMKILTNWIISIKDESISDIESVAKPILSMLSSYINRGGEIVTGETTPPNFCSRLRLHAGFQILKITQHSVFDSLIDQRRINRLILLIQDAEIQVRSKFIAKLKKKLTQHKLSKRLLPLLYFVAHEPDQAIRESTSIWIRASFEKYANKPNSSDLLIFEKSFVNAIHMIFNHPEFKELYTEYISLEDINEPASNDSTKASKFEELATFALTYIIYFLSVVATVDNISVLFYLSQSIKQYKGKSIFPDSTGFDDDALYLLAELAEISVKYVGRIRNYSIPVWPGKLNLPSDLFEKLETTAANSNIKRNFITDAEFVIVETVIKSRWKIENGSGILRKGKKKSASTNNLTIEEHNSGKRKDQNLDKDVPLKKVKPNYNKNNREDLEYSEPSLNANKENSTRRNRSSRAKRINYSEN